jgi:hypothetical protein
VSHYPTGFCYVPRGSAVVFRGHESLRWAKGKKRKQGNGKKEKEIDKKKKESTKIKQL